MKEIDDQRGIASTVNNLNKDTTILQEFVKGCDELSEMSYEFRKTWNRDRKIFNRLAYPN